MIGVRTATALRTTGRPDLVSPAWSRRKLHALLAGAVLVGVLLLLGLGAAIWFAIRPHSAPGRPTGAAQGSPRAAPADSAATGTSGLPPEQVSARDELAARAMPAVALSASRPAPVSTRDPGSPIHLPAPTTIGPAGVPTGFPRSPAGALAQLAAIDQVALQSGSMDTVRAVIADWAMPGGPTTTSWSGVHAMSDLLSSAHLSGGGSPQLSVTLTPMMGLFKGSVGFNFVIPCVDFEIDVTLNQTARAAVADCQRMVWTGERWMIGPGSEPADAPSIWPDTDQAIDAGYVDVRRG